MSMLISAASDPLPIQQGLVTIWFTLLYRSTVDSLNIEVNIHCSLSNNITLYMPYYQEGRVGIPYTSLTLPHFCACPKPGPGFPKSYDVGFFSVQWISLRWEGIVSFIDIGGIDGHHCLHILFIIFIHPSRDGPYYVIGYGGWRAGIHTGFRTINLVL